jgi:hypothetical protein
MVEDPVHVVDRLPNELRCDPERPLRLVKLGDSRLGRFKLGRKWTMSRTAFGVTRVRRIRSMTPASRSFAHNGSDVFKALGFGPSTSQGRPQTAASASISMRNEGLTRPLTCTSELAGGVSVTR